MWISLALETVPPLTLIALRVGLASLVLRTILPFRDLKLPMGTASQAYLRSGIGVVLGVVFLNEVLDLETLAGICLAISGVVLINWKRRGLRKQTVQEGAS